MMNIFLNIKWFININTIIGTTACYMLIGKNARRMSSIDGDYLPKI